MLLWLFWTIAWFPAKAEDYSDIEIFNENEQRARMLLVNGNMYFHAGASKNITFIANGGGSIWLGNTDISKLPQLQQVMSHDESLGFLKDRLTTAETKQSSMARAFVTLSNVTKFLIQSTKNISKDVTTLIEWKKNRQVRDVRFRRLMGRLSKTFKGILAAINANGCKDNPCNHGGTCIPTLGKFVCLCPPHRTGPTCEQDLDECEVLEKSCFHDGVCKNVENGYICDCQKGFHGPRCEYEHSSCRKTPGLCGKGHCIESDDPNSNIDYKCICEYGYQSYSIDNPTCIDINECDDSPCHPGVECINLPGSFQCSGCPKGYQGNGKLCVDIDECSQANYPCSTSPRAPCYNTVGSYYCGACPLGFRGDGKSCRRVSGCQGRPCHPQATCVDDLDNINAGGFVCHCPSGYLGDGIGIDGCKKGNSTICRADGRCLNGGTCKAVSEDSYICACPENYFGSRCEKVSECISAPCQNGGKCQYDVTDGYSCLCAEGFYGQDCEMEETACGEHYTQREGKIAFPTDLGLNTSQNCDIVIQPRSQNEAIRITFTQFDDMLSQIPGPTDCRTTYGNVTIYDGDNDNANKLATFCGARTGPKGPLVGKPITLSGSRAMIRFRGSKGKFTIKWEMKKRECGYRTTASSGSLVVPTHRMDTSCDWFITAPSGQVIELEIPQLVLSSGDWNCSTNELEAFDGYTDYDAHSIVQICSSTNDTVKVRTTGPFLTVSFSSVILYGDDADTQRGFEMRYKMVEPDKKCGGDIVLEGSSSDFSGEITSPNFGSFYPPNMDCTWKIDGLGEDNETSDQQVKLEFQIFDVESTFVYVFPRVNPWRARTMGRYIRRRPWMSSSAARCSQDYLRIYSDGQLQHDGCNSHLPPTTMVLPGPQALLQFHSDEQTQGKGFKIQYSMVCEKSFTGNGTIRTWNYPDGGRKGVCKYKISAPQSHILRVKFKTIGLRVVNTTMCLFRTDLHDSLEDYVKLSGGREDNRVLNKKYVCQRWPFVEESEFVLSPVRPLTIEYASSGDPRNRGLLIEYTSSNIGCGGVFTSSSGTISSPNYPEKYLPHLHCVYQINVAWSKQVRLTFDNFDLEVEQRDECSYDRVEIYESYTTDTIHGKLLAKFCGSMSPPAILSSRYSMAVVFITDRSVAGRGFSARFESVDTSVDCDRTFTSPTGIISFDGSLGRFFSCDYHISLPYNSRILLKVDNMTLPCDKGQLHLRNGPAYESPGFPQLYGESEICDQHSQESPIRSQSNRMFLRLTTTDSAAVSFNISYEQYASSCGGAVTGISGTLAAPQYPQKDSRAIDCAWTIAVSPGNKVRYQVSLTDDFKSSDDYGYCGVFAANRLDIFDGPNDDARLMRRYCKKAYASEPIESDDHEILVKYRQIGGIRTGALFGFLSHFTTVCSGIIHESAHGTIQSPGYPSPVYVNRYCDWKIQAPQGNRIRATFHFFNIEHMYRGYYGNRRCLDNYLKMSNVGEATVQYPGQSGLNVTTDITNFCNSAAKPITVTSDANKLVLQFQSKRGETNHFWMTWITLGCGEDVITPSNLTVNLDHLDNKSDVYECKWTIKAPIGQKIIVHIDTFLIYPRELDKDHCKYDFDNFTGIDIYNGLNVYDGADIDTICRGTKDEAIHFSSHTNEILLRLKIQKRDLANMGEKIIFNAVVNFAESKNIGDDCGGEVYVPIHKEKTVTTPRFPKDYPPNSRCSWLFKTDPGYRLQFVLNCSKVESSTTDKNNDVQGMSPNATCQNPMQLIVGSVAFYHGRNRSSGLADRTCLNQHGTKTIDVNTHESFVRFEGASTVKVHLSGENEFNKKLGFTVTASAVCGDILYANSEKNIFGWRSEQGNCTIVFKRNQTTDNGISIAIDDITKRSSDYGEMGYILACIDESDCEKVHSMVSPGSKGVLIPHTHEEHRGMSEIKLHIVVTKEYHHALVVTYSTDLETCGSQLTKRKGVVSSPSLREDSECIWTISENPGNLAKLQVESLLIPPALDEHCSESFLEVRANNASGPILLRTCGEQDWSGVVVQNETLWVRLRYRKPEPEDEDEILEGDLIPQGFVKFTYWREFGGQRLTDAAVIQSPAADISVEYAEWILDATNEYDEKGILITIDHISFPNIEDVAIGEIPQGLFIVTNKLDQIQDDDLSKLYSAEVLLDSTTHHYAGFNPPPEIYLPHDKVAIVAHGIHNSRNNFKLHWEPVARRSNNSEAEDKYNCGGVLTPTSEWQELRNPPPSDGGTGYDNFLNCRWTMARPLLRGIQIKMIKIDLEASAAGCEYDFLAVIPDEDEADEVLSMSRMCERANENLTMNYNYNKAVHIHFVTDMSRSRTGFILKYRLSCNSYDYITKENGIFDTYLTNPGYPTTALEDNCVWTILLASHRRISVTVVDLNLATRQSGECKDDLLVFNSRRVSQDNNYLCGSLTDNSALNYTFTQGHLMVKYQNKNKDRPKGFRIHIQEVLEDCASSELFIDESMPAKNYTTPLYPNLLANSLNCQYIIRAPNGHRIQFTIDPHNFRIESINEDSCICDTCDWVEIRDGPSEKSPLIGRYCDTNPPSTVTSTSNFLFFQIRTDSFAQSNGFRAEYKLAECGGTVVLRPNKTSLIRSPKFPDAFPQEIECLWTVRSPNAHMIHMSINHLWMTWNVNCSADRLSVYDGLKSAGNETVPYLIPPQCHGGQIPQLDYRSSSSIATVEFIANSTVSRPGPAFCKNRKCGFELELKVSDVACGGVLDGNAGTITTPGYPGRLLPFVTCQWDLRAGAGYRYMLDFEFTDPERHGFYQRRSTDSSCFLDLRVFNGKRSHERANFNSNRYFCQKQTTFLSEADIATIYYTDRPTIETQKYSGDETEDFYYVPFRLNYTKVPDFTDEQGCTHEITTNASHFVGGYNITDHSQSHYCHFLVKRPPNYQTTIIRIKDYSDEQGQAFSCSDFNSFIELESVDDGPRVIDERICNVTFFGKSMLTRAFLNEQIHIHVFTIISMFSRQPPQQFTLEVEFQACGGIITNPNAGTISSPNFGDGNVYLPNSICVWQIQAPEAMVVWVNVTHMDVEFDPECRSDELSLGEGKTNDVFHKYCNHNAANGSVLEVPERFRSFRSHSRYMTVNWVSNSENEFSGWKLDYEFQDEGHGCGFATHAVSGVIHTPNYPKDYENDDECVWDIQVPVGFKIKVKFTHFDIEMAENCANDALIINEEHGARGNEPLGDYYFLYESEETNPPMCGFNTPKPYESTANRLRLQFSSNERVTGKGFRAEWSAVCGAVFRLKHYTIVSPYYPNGYPNQDSECNYLIDPEYEDTNYAITFKMQDFDLSTVRFESDRYPCESDYVEVFSVLNNEVIVTFCAQEEVSNEVFTAQGPVGIRFITNYTSYNFGRALKPSRGFEMTYSIKRCGGEFNLTKENLYLATISSPAFPLDYPHNLNCWWKIVTEPDRVLSIKIVGMMIESTTDCEMDALEFYDGNNSTDKLMAKYCGERVPDRRLRTKNNTLWAHFVTDYSISMGGFKAVVTATLGSASGCGGSLRSVAEWSTLKPPTIRDNYYNNLHCGWTITGPENTMIEFKLNSIDTEHLRPLPGDKPKQICVDFLAIYDGYKSFSPLLAQDICTETVSTLPAMWHSSHRVAHVYFETDADGTGKGFELQFRSVKPDCGDWLTATNSKQTVEFKSKSLSEAHLGQTFQRCQWVIQSKEQIPIWLHIRDIQVPSPAGDCSDAYIEIRDVGSISKCQHPACITEEHEKRVFRYCGNQARIAPFISNTMAVQITVATILSKESFFKIEYEKLSACNRTIDLDELPSGRLTSPNYPKPYDHNATCITKLKGSKGQKIMLVFNKFSLERSRSVYYEYNNATRYYQRIVYPQPQCDFDYMQINENGQLLKKYCGAQLPPTFYSNSSELDIIIVTDHNIAGEGFDLSYYSEKYTEVNTWHQFKSIKDPSGALSNIEFPGYGLSRTERYYIQPPTGLNCKFIVEPLSLAKGSTNETECLLQEEYLLLELPNNNDPEKSISLSLRSCSHEDTVQFNLPPDENRKLTVEFKSDENSANDGTGFHMSWECTSHVVPQV